MPHTDFAALADAGWPAIERTDVGGWVARFARGVTQRANSVYPAGVVDDADAAIAEVERLYREHGLPAVFQLADGDAALRDALTAHRYSERSETLVLAADADAVRRALEGGRGGDHGDPATVACEPDEEWLGLWWSVDGRGGASESEVARRILTGGPALYATTRDGRGAASVGRLALVDRDGTGWGGIYALATRADARGRGHARAVISALVDRGAERGTTALWLQVLASNDIALRLYHRLGFRRVATYRYLVAPD